MISAEIGFADSGLLEIAGPKAETKKLILLVGGEGRGGGRILLCHCSGFAINFSICAVLFVSGDELNSTDNNNNILSISKNILVYFKPIEVDSTNG